jgi:SAM-dependent methyltransferase
LLRDDQTRALLLLLGDADSWWDEPAPPEADLRRALEATTLREAAAWLGLGRVGDYFAHRWSDPTYLAGLGLLAQAWPTRPGRVVEIACGVGHYLRELELRGVGDLVGIDVVFSKLWLARRFVCPSARYLCLDATARLPFADAGAELVLCQDAIYFLPEQEQVLAEMQRVGRTVAVGHAHLPGQPGRPRSADEWAALLPGATVYDDIPVTAPDLGAPLPGRSLRVNPLYRDGQREWPNDRYAAEYGPRATYLPDVLTDADLADEATAYRRRLLLDLPERW